MNKKKLLQFFIILIILIDFSFTALSQSNFTADSIQAELKEYYEIKNSNLQNDSTSFIVDSLINSFSAILNTKVSTEDKHLLVDLLNYQRVKNFKKETSILNFIKTTVELQNSKKNDFDPWLKMLENIMNSPNITSSVAEMFIDNTYLLLSESYLKKSNTSQWKLTDGSFSFLYDEKNKTFRVKVLNCNLEAYSIDDDTIRILQTSGTYDIIESNWTGKKGKITWERYGFPSSEINVRLQNYKINMNKTEFRADTVTFKNKHVLNYEITGSVLHRASRRGFKEGKFPQFRSYGNNYEIKSNFKNIRFLSGIEMLGKTVRYVGTEEKQASAEYLRNGKVFMKAYSTYFSLLDNKLQSKQCRLTLFIAQNDSIIHPNINLIVQDSLFSFNRNPEGTGNRPFYDSYQEIYFEADNITWIENDSAFSLNSKLGNEAGFKSKDYFTKSDFTKQRMYETQNPLFTIKKFTRIKETRTFHAYDYAQFVKQAPTGVVHRLMGLWYEGFLEYNPNTKMVTVNDKLFDYIDYFFDKKDYDVINVISKGIPNPDKTVLYPTRNGYLHLNTHRMTLYGVDQVVINERKKVGFVPKNKTILIDKNRNMFFNGRLRVGLADFYGNGFAFNYENYEIQFIDTDSLVYRVWDKEFTETGPKDKAVYLTSSIENVSGRVRIDVKTNKSGAKEISQFPKFTSNDTSYVYYDRRNKHGDAYPRESFYFKNFPFEHDSLLYIHKDELKIAGLFYSGDIFPVLLDTLEVQNDYSLGFFHKTAEGGIDLFQGKVSLSAKNSTLDSYIRLSNQGLEANGVATWNNTTIATRDFTIYPDSLVALADEIVINEYINDETYAEFPDVKGKLVQTKWDAENDYVIYKTTGMAVDMYEGKAKFSGTFVYRPSSLTGKGFYTLNDGTIQSEEFTFNKNNVLAENSTMTLKEKNSNEKNVIINKMKSFVDINNDKAVFQKIEEEGDYSNVHFVSNEYMSYPDHLVWHTNEGKINLDYNMNKFTNPIFSKEEKLLDSAYLINEAGFDKNLFSSAYGTLKFISINQDQDSLMFFGSRANYFTGNKNIVAKDVQRIIVADIVVTPTSDIVINDDGEMEKLLKTTVRARGLHLITEVDIKINSSKKYVASSGIYQYEDMNNQMQNIYFDNITYDENVDATVAHGFVEQYHNFTLNPWFEYYGDVYFNATKDHLRFEGYAKLIHTCPSTPKWFYFKTDINPDSVYLPLEPKLHSDISINKARIFADVMTARDSVHSFPVFLSTDPYGTSESLLSLRDSSYYVSYLENDNKYVITTLEKFNNKLLPGNYMDLKRGNCIFNAEGKFNFSKSIKINQFNGTGNIRFDMNSGEVTMQNLMIFDFFFNKKSLDIMTENLKLQSGLGVVRVSDDAIKKLSYEYMGVDKTDRMLAEMSENVGQPRRFPKELNKTLVFTNVFFKWDQKSESFKSFGKIGISNIGDQMINKYVNGYIQIIKDRTGDKAFVYLELSKDQWYFFIFSGGILRTLSSDHQYNVAIEELKTKDKRFKTDKGIFNYMMTNKETKDNFIYQFTGVHPATDEFDDFDDEFEDEE